MCKNFHFNKENDMLYHIYGCTKNRKLYHIREGNSNARADNSDKDTFTKNVLGICLFYYEARKRVR